VTWFSLGIPLAFRELCLIQKRSKR